MAKIYGEIGASALMTFDKSFARSNGQPLDSTEVFYSKSAAETYAAGDVAYVGQKIVVVETVKKNVDGVETDVTVVTHYSIEPDNSLKELGSATGGDISALREYVGTFDSETAGTVVEYVDEAVASVDERITTIEDDYLRTKDKEDVLDAVDELSGYVGTIPQGVQASTVVDYIDEKISAEIREIPAPTDYSVTVTEDSSSGDYAKVYTFKQLGSSIATINIPKDMVVESGSVVALDDGEVEGLAAGTYIKLVLANATNDKLFINVGDLIEYVTSGSGANDMIVINVDADHKVTATITDGTVTLAKLETSIQTAIGKAHSHDNENVLKDITAEKVTAWDAAQVNVIDSVDTDQFALDENKKLTLLDVAMDKVTGLADALEDKVDKVAGSRLISAEEASKLEKLVLGENGSVQVSGTIAAGNVDGLADWITSRAGTLEGLSENNFSDALKTKLDGIAAGAQVNVIDIVKVDGVALPVGEDKSVEIPGALQASMGVVKGTGDADGISINDDHTMVVNSLNVNKLYQNDGDVLILDGGSLA